LGLLIGVERAETAQRRAKRAAYVEMLLSSIPILDFSAPMALIHARMIANLPKRVTAGAHDAIIAATAIYHGHAVLTRNISDFRIFSGLSVEPFET
jgi:tRNA(fMet)-specific endonuclease VapC